VQAALAVLVAAVVAGVEGESLPLAAGPAGSLEIAPRDSVGDVALALWSELALTPVVLGGALAVGAAALLLPWAARHTAHGVAAIGGALLVCAVATGTGVVALLVSGVVWAVAVNVAARTAR
jgi:hypothetical protein